MLVQTTSCELESSRAKRAVQRAQEVKPLLVEFPAEIVMTYMRTDHADGAARRRGVERIDSRTVKWTAADSSELFG